MSTFLRSLGVARSSARTFSTTPRRCADISKLILVGRLGKQPETRTTQSNKEYMMYTVATNNYPPPPANADGSRSPGQASWHHILCFNPNTFDYLRTLQKGTQVYVEANYELREADTNADPESPQGQRQIFLRHETIRVLSKPPRDGEHSESS